MLALTFFLLVQPTTRSRLFPYTTLFRSFAGSGVRRNIAVLNGHITSGGSVSGGTFVAGPGFNGGINWPSNAAIFRRSEEHTSELQSHSDLVCRLLLEKKKKEKSLSTATV